MRIILAVATAILISACAANSFGSAWDDKCWRYERDTLSLAGRLSEKTFPGPPNYESIADGDFAEKGYYLALNRPVCMMFGEIFSLDSIPEVQLPLDSTGYSRLRPALGRRVTLRATLSDAHTGHHHAAALATVVW